MKLHKNVFFYFAMLVFLACVFLALSSVLSQLGASQEYPYLLKGECLVTIILMLLTLLGVGTIWSRLQINAKLNRYPTLTSLLEALSGALLLVVGMILSLACIN